MGDDFFEAVQRGGDLSAFSMTTVSALLRDIRHCRLCAEKLPFEPRPVVQFHPSARILIAAQAPGRKVHETGIPFNDASGDRLRAWLGLSREVFYDDRRIAILPMGFCYPGTGKSGDLPPRPECAPAWRETLLSQFEDLQLTLDWRETWPDRVPLPHPSPRNNRWLKNNPWFAECLLPDLRRRVAEVLSDSEE